MQRDLKNVVTTCPCLLKSHCLEMKAVFEKLCVPRCCDVPT